MGTLEFPDLGSHCSNPICKQLDFLPFVCIACNLTFCLDHRTPENHNCTKKDGKSVPSCPICGVAVPVSKGEDPNIKMDEHISSGCAPVSGVSNVPSFNKCNFTRCTGKEVVPILCILCKKNFCFAHRHPPDHQCEMLGGGSPAPEGIAKKPRLSTKDVLQRIEALQQLEKSKKPTAIKVQMIKMRSKAKGDEKIPVERRFYAEVVFPLDSGVETKIMYFDSKWTIGKTLDVIATAGSITNNNHKPGAEKLYLISLKTGEVIPNAKTLLEIGEPLRSGDSLLLEKLASLEGASSSSSSTVSTNDAPT